MLLACDEGERCDKLDPLVTVTIIADKGSCISRHEMSNRSMMYVLDLRARVREPAWVQS